MFYELPVGYLSVDDTRSRMWYCTTFLLHQNTTLVFTLILYAAHCNIMYSAVFCFELQKICT